MSFVKRNSNTRTKLRTYFLDKHFLEMNEAQFLQVSRIRYSNGSRKLDMSTSNSHGISY